MSAMPRTAHTPVTELIAAARDGGPQQREALYAAIYDELKAIARRTPHVGRDGDTMQATVLVNEIYLELERRFPLPPKEMVESRATFYRSVALAMRSVLRDHWRAKAAQKRGGGERARPLCEACDGAQDDGFLEAQEFLALDAALGRLEAFNARWYDVVMQRYFAGRTIEQTAAVLGVASSTVINDWRLARSWLTQEIECEA